MVDSKGLVTTSRGDELPAHKKIYARTDGTPDMKDLTEIVKYAKPHAVIGLTGGGEAWGKVTTPPPFTPLASSFLPSLSACNQESVCPVPCPLNRQKHPSPDACSPTLLPQLPLQLDVQQLTWVAMLLSRIYNSGNWCAVPLQGQTL